MVTFDSPEACALVGYSESAGARVAVCAVTEEHAAALVVTSTPEYPYLVMCHRSDDGWEEGSSGNGTIQWSLTDEEPDRGVLVVWGKSAGQAPHVRVGEERMRPTALSADGYWLVLMVGVPEDVLWSVEIDG